MCFVHTSFKKKVSVNFCKQKSNISNSMLGDTGNLTSWFITMSFSWFILEYTNPFYCWKQYNGHYRNQLILCFMFLFYDLTRNNTKCFRASLHCLKYMLLLFFVEFYLLSVPDVEIAVDVCGWSCLWVGLSEDGIDWEVSWMWVEFHWVWSSEGRAASGWVD